MRSTQYTNISNLRGGSNLTHWQQTSRQKKALSSLRSQKNLENRPTWNDGLAENPHKLSHAEILTKKLNAKSKNEATAREEVRQKMESLKSGKMPKEY